MGRNDAEAARLARDLRRATAARSREASATRRAEQEARLREPLAVKARRMAGRPFDPVRAVAAGDSGAGPDGLRLPLASLMGEDADWHDEVVVGGVGLPALEAPPPSVLRVPVRCAGGAVRAFAGMRPAAWFRNRGGVRFVLRLKDAGGATRSETALELTPCDAPAARSWRPMVLGLPSSGTALLEFATEVPAGARGDYAWALWGDPVVLVPAPGATVVPLPRRATRRPAPTPPAPAVSGPELSLLLPVHDPDPGLLRGTLTSVLTQRDPSWQLCVVDDGSVDPRVQRELHRVAGDPRVRMRRHDRAAGISGATNAALALATGAFVATLDHDDLLDADAVAMVRAALAAAPGTDVLYTDNDKVGPRGERFAPSLKPGWSPEHLRACMYTLHLGVYRRALVEAVGGWRPAFDGAQDHDLVLRLSERTDRVLHLPRVAYAWRAHAGSAALGGLAKPVAYERGAAAVREHIHRLGLDADVERLPVPGRYRVRYRPRAWDAGCVVLVDPGAQALDELADALGMAVELADAPHGAATLPALRAAAERVRHDVLILVEDLAVPEDGGWRAELLGPLDVPGVVASSPVVLTADGAVRHAGVALVDGRPMPVHPGRRLDDPAAPPELTMVTNRAALSGVVAIHRAALDRDELRGAAPGLVLPALVAALTAEGGRAVCSPHAPWVAAAGADPAIDLAAQRAFASAHRARADAWYHPMLWRDRGDHRPPSALEHRAAPR